MTQPMPEGFEFASRRTAVFEFLRWDTVVGERTVVEAETVSFDGGALVFRTGLAIVLAVKAGDWNDLRQHTDPNTSAPHWCSGLAPEVGS